MTHPEAGFCVMEAADDRYYKGEAELPTLRSNASRGRVLLGKRLR